MTAGLLRELVEDPGLPDAGEAAWLDMVERRRVACGRTESRDARDPFEAALLVSALPSKPLLDPPTRFDDERDWAGVGLDDLEHFARFGSDKTVARAARVELRRRKASAPDKADRRPGRVRHA